MAPSATGFTPIAKDKTREVSTNTARLLSADKAEALEDLETLAKWFDDRFTVPGTQFRFGLDSIAGLIPGVGDTLTAGVSALLVLRAKRLGVRNSLVLRMLSNVGVDWLVGSIPLVGDIFDFAFKANRKNIALLKRELLLERS